MPYNSSVFDSADIPTTRPVRFYFTLALLLSPLLSALLCVGVTGVLLHQISVPFTYLVLAAAGIFTMILDCLRIAIDGCNA